MTVSYLLFQHSAVLRMHVMIFIKAFLKNVIKQLLLETKHLQIRAPGEELKWKSHMHK